MIPYIDPWFPVRENSAWSFEFTQNFDQILHVCHIYLHRKTIINFNTCRSILQHHGSHTGDKSPPSEPIRPCRTRSPPPLLPPTTFQRRRIHGDAAGRSRGPAPSLDGCVMRYDSRDIWIWLKNIDTPNKWSPTIDITILIWSLGTLILSHCHIHRFYWIL